MNLGFISTGNNPRMVHYHKRLGIKTIQMNQYVLVNHSVKNNIILSFKKEYKIKQFSLPSSKTVYKKILPNNILNIETIYNKNFNSYVNKKPFHVFTRKYIHNPYHQYIIILVEHPELSLLVFRKLKYKNNYIVKLVEYYSDQLNLMTVSDISREEFFYDKNCEAVSFYCFTNREIDQANFVKVKRDGHPLCCPNHFKPFSDKYIEIFCSFNFDSESILITSGDADQDRAS